MFHISILPPVRIFLSYLLSIYLFIRFVRHNVICIMLLILIVFFMASCAVASQSSQGESTTKEILVEKATESDKSSIKEDFMSIAPYAKEGYYYQVAAYRGEMSQDILAQIEKYPYIVLVSEQGSKPMYHYLIGAYDTIESMNTDKKAIYALTKNTHIQKNMKPIVCYVNKNNESIEVHPNSSIIEATEVRFGKIVNEIGKDNAVGALANTTNTNEVQENEIVVNVETTDETESIASKDNTDETYLATQSQDSQNPQENIALVLVQDTNFNDERCANVCETQNSEYYLIREKRRNQGRRDNFILLPPSK